MATVTIRNLEDRVIRELKARASANRRSLEAELRELLGEAARRQIAQRRFLAEADRIAALTPKGGLSDSVALIREDRDR